MKNSLIAIILMFSFISLQAGNGFKVKFSEPQPGTFILDFNLGDYRLDDMVANNMTFTDILFEGSIRTRDKGFASLPYLSAAVRLPDDRNMSLSVTLSEFTDIQLDYPLLPSRGIIYRDQDPSAIPYEISPEALRDEWYPASLAEQTQPFIVRDVRGSSVYVYPFRYNAVQNVLRVYTRLQVTLLEDNTPVVNPLSRTSNTITREMDGVYRSVFINYDNGNRDDLTVGEVGDILVICTARDEAAIEPYIQWKKEKGYNVSKEVVATGTNVDNLVQQKYDENNNLLYVQLVGDWPDIKSNTLGYGSPMDPQLGCVAGTDEYADICIGRLSSNNAGHVTTQVNKIIGFEKTPDMGESWYSVATGIASDQGPGDDNERDYEHNDVIFDDKLDPFTYDTYNAIYDPSASISMVNNAVNGGTSVINYTGHGSSSGWGSSGFSNSNVNNLSNGTKLPFIVSVACNNGDFHQTSGDCFAEAWLKKDNGGAVMFLGASISQPWDPPMRGQDYFMDVMTGGYDYSAHPGQSGISTSEQRTTIGSMVFNGLTLMCTESGGADDWETAKTWNLFGDPSLQVRTAEPMDIVTSNNVIIGGIPFVTIISADGNPVENAMVAISQGDNYYRGFTDASGLVSITHSFTPGNALLVVTGFNTGTIYQTIDVIPASGAYIVYAYHEVNDQAGNGNGVIDYGETVKLSVALTNIGSDDASAVATSLSTGDTYVTLVDFQENYGNIPAGDTVYVEDAFEITVAGDVPDMHGILFDIVAEGEQTWTSNFTDIAHAPELIMSAYLVEDPSGNANGKLDPGEDANIIMTIENAGTSDAADVDGVLASLSPYVTINTGSLGFGNLAAGSSASQSYEVAVDNDTPAGHSAGFEFDISAYQGVSGSGSFFLVVGQIPVLIVDLDGNNNSADAMMQCCDNLGVGAEMVSTIPNDLNLYSSVFICLGVYPDNHVLSSQEGDAMADYLDEGGNIYLEGADTWAFDTQTSVHPMFSINGDEDGNGDMSDVKGQDGTIAADLEYEYSGDNNYMDHILPLGQAFTMFKNLSPSYNCMIANDAGSYKTIGASLEFGGLDDGTSTKDELMIVILDFFGIEGIWTALPEAPGSAVSGLTIFPNPVNENSQAILKLDVATHVDAGLFTGEGKKILSLVSEEMDKGTHVLSLRETATLPQGLYLLKISTDAGHQTRKLVVVH